jgi:phage terminase large subunit-like protein
MVEHDHEFYAGDVVVSNCFAWLEELAAWAKLDQCFDHLQLGLRLGPHPRAIASTTPKPRPLIKALVADETHVAVTRATTADNPYLAERVRARYYERYGGTRLGQQELEGLVLDDVVGALWRRDMIRYRAVEELP